MRVEAKDRFLFSYQYNTMFPSAVIWVRIGGLQLDQVSSFHRFCCMFIDCIREYMLIRWSGKNVPSK